MEFIFWITTIVSLICVLFKIFILKDIFGLGSYLLVGVYQPLLLSFCDWSSFHIVDRPGEFYYVFVILNICYLLYFKLSKRLFIGSFDVVTKGGMSLEIINLVFIGSVLIESYHISGYFFPFLNGIDIHTYRAPILYYFTTGLYCFAILNLFEYISTKNKKYLLYIVVLLVINIASKASRIDVFICFVQIMSFYLFYYFSNNKIQECKSKIFLIMMLVFVMVLGGIKVGNDRMNSFDKYQLVYSEGIDYYGPVTYGEICAYYYGYFALSFDNFAYNIATSRINENYLGLNTFRTLYFGVLQFDNLFDLDGGEAVKANNIRCKAAAIPTGFWDFWYDYGYFIFVPILISFMFSVILLYKIFANISLGALACYFYWIPLWLFMSFDNRLYNYQVLVHLVMLYFYINFRYIIKKR